MKLCRKPTSYFGSELDGFLNALHKNTVVHTVEFSWKFLTAVSVTDRILLMKSIGGMTALEKLMMEVVGPCEILVAALEQAKHLKLLWIGALRISSHRDVFMLERALRQNTSIIHINLYNIRLQVQGNYRIDQGRVWFEEAELTEKVNLNPLLSTIAQIQSLEKLFLELQLNADKMERIDKKVVESLCQKPRKALMISSCDLNDKDAQVLADEMARSNTCCLEYLNLGRGNRITDCGWEALATMMEYNYTITEFFVPSESTDRSGLMQVNELPARRYAKNASATPGPSDRIREKLGLYVRLNQKGRKNLLCGNICVTRQSWLSFLALDTNDLDVIFYTLQAAPSLFTG